MNGIDIPYSQSVSTSGGGFWGGFNATLAAALQYDLQRQQLKAQQNSQGVDRMSYNAVIEVPAGKAVSIDEQKITPQSQAGQQQQDGSEIVIMGTPVNKNLLIFSAVILGLAVYLKKGR
ncbi:hypothetical protein [Arsukibacterium sp.]|uniref:hypothetical protein n=1 Tax=Arsukibacterium sp. TaxID=1977258 RepID=UPI002FDAD900